MKRAQMNVLQGLWATFFLALLVPFGCTVEKDARSVILITIDTLRADHLSGAGYSQLTSPAMDAFARRGSRFEWAFSTSSYTVPSHASMLVGMYPSYHSVGLLNGQYKLHPAETTLAEILSDGGWETAAIVSNAMLARAMGLDQGFESYDDDLPDRELVRRMRERRASNAVDRALEKISEFGDQPFFLWLHLQDPHGPYTPPALAAGLDGSSEERQAGRVLPIGRDYSGFRAIPAYQTYGTERGFDEYRARYDREIQFLDGELARLVAYLDERQLLQHSLVAITADHGEAMGEDEFYFAHGHSVGLDQVRVPLFFVGDGVRSGQTVSAPVTNMSVFATILEYLGQPLPPDVQSQSLFATLTNGDDVPRGPLYTESYTQRGIVDDGYYLRTDRRPASNERFWRVSPISGGYIAPLGTQTMRLGSSMAEEVPSPEKLKRRLQAFDRSAELVLKSFETRALQSELSQEQIEELRVLGYAQ
jgi:arylsulfatase A-like enzyme